MKRGFTLIELMVASVLLAMVVVVITMIFNQSSIAWRTGAANVRNLSASRQALGTLQDIRDEVLPGLGQNSSGGGTWSGSPTCRNVSLWDSNARNSLRSANDRAFNAKEGAIQWGKAPNFSMSDAQKASALDVQGQGRSGQSSGGFSVGVRSWGPDRRPDTADDINTWPEEID